MQLTTAGDEYAPSFSADGRTIVFERIIPYPKLLGPWVTSPFAIDIASRKERRLTTQTYAAGSNGEFIHVSMPYFRKNDATIVYAGSEWNIEGHDTIGKSGVFEIAVARTDKVAQTAPRRLNPGRLQGTVADATPLSGAGSFVLSGTQSATPWGGLSIFRSDSRATAAIRSVAGTLICHRPAPGGGDSLYFLAETGREPSGSAISSLWMCSLTGPKPATEVISLADLARLQ